MAASPIVLKPSGQIHLYEPDVFSYLPPEHGKTPVLQCHFTFINIYERTKFKIDKTNMFHDFHATIVPHHGTHLKTP